MPTTHPRERFDMYARPLDLGTWSYVLDDFGDAVAFGKRPLWPFASDHVRLSPDVDYRSWRNEYVLAGLADDTTAEAGLTLLVRPQGMGGAVVHAPIRLDLTARTVSLIHFDDLPDVLRAEAMAKGQRILDLLARECARRDAGAPRPVAAYDLAQPEG